MWLRQTHFKGNDHDHKANEGKEIEGKIVGFMLVFNLTQTQINMLAIYCICVGDYRNNAIISNFHAIWVGDMATLIFFSNKKHKTSIAIMGGLQQPNYFQHYFFLFILISNQLQLIKRVSVCGYSNEWVFVVVLASHSAHIIQSDRFKSNRGNFIQFPN